MATEQQVLQQSQGYTTGVKFLKINKTDGDGNDATAFLENCQVISVGYTEDGFAATYDVISRTDKGTYFLFNVSPNNVNGNRLPFSSSIRQDWQFKVSATSITETGEATQIFADVAPGGVDTDVRGNWTQTSDKGGSGNFVYYFNDQQTSFPIGHRLRTTITSGVAKQTVEAQLVQYTLPSNPGIILPPTSQYIIYRENITLSSGVNIEDIQYYGPLLPNTKYWWQIMTSSAAPNGEDLSNLTFNTSFYTFLSSSYHAFAPSSQSVITEPQIFNDNFDQSDFNPLINNATTEEISDKYRKVDYDNGNIIPSNISLIERNAAEFADVKDYYYTLRRHTLPRYEGSKNTSADINIRGKENDPPVEQLATAFSNLIGAGGQSPEYIDKTFFNTNKLIDANANVFNAKDPTTSQYIDWKYLFPEGSEVVVDIQPANAGFGGYSGLSGTHKVLRVGTLKTKLITGQSTGSQDYVNKINFIAAQGSAQEGLPDYRLTAFRGSDQTGLGDGTSTVIFDQVGLNDGEGTDFAYAHLTGIYTVSTDPSEVLFNINTVVSVKNERFTLNPDTDTVRVMITKNGTTNLNLQIAEIDTDTGDGGGTFTFNVSANGLQLSNGDNIRIRLESSTNLKTVQAAGTSFTVNQDPAPAGEIEETTFLNVVSALGNTALGTGNFLVFSEGISNNYGLRQELSSSQTDFGYAQRNIVPFEPSPGDEIRFGYSEENAYTITKVYPPGTVEAQPTRLYLEIDKVLNGAQLATTRNHFILRSFKDDNAGMTLDVEKRVANSATISGTTKESSIRPRFLSQELENNFSNIIRTLTNEGII